jgi:hypothetical protein
MDRRSDRHFRRRRCLAPNIGVTAGPGVKTMTISVQRVVVTAALLLSGVAASARAQAIETVTTVPFEFAAGDTNLPRDRYRITPLPGQNGVFMIRGARHGVVVMSQLERRNDREATPSLTFYRYGEKYFLREVQLGDGRILKLSQTRAELEAAEYVAAQAAAKSRVVVASSSPK